MTSQQFNSLFLSPHPTLLVIVSFRGKIINTNFFVISLLFFHAIPRCVCVFGGVTFYMVKIFQYNKSPCGVFYTLASTFCVNDSKSWAKKITLLLHCFLSLVPGYFVSSTFHGNCFPCSAKCPFWLCIFLPDRSSLTFWFCFWLDFHFSDISLRIIYNQFCSIKLFYTLSWLLSYMHNRIWGHLMLI